MIQFYTIYSVIMCVLLLLEDHDLNLQIQPVSYVDIFSLTGFLNSVRVDSSKNGFELFTRYDDKTHKSENHSILQEQINEWRSS